MKNSKLQIRIAVSLMALCCGIALCGAAHANDLETTHRALENADAAQRDARERTATASAALQTAFAVYQSARSNQKRAQVEYELAYEAYSAAFRVAAEAEESAKRAAK